MLGYQVSKLNLRQWSSGGLGGDMEVDGWSDEMVWVEG